jgi:hypothetical protein
MRSRLAGALQSVPPSTESRGKESRSLVLLGSNPVAAFDFLKDIRVLLLPRRFWKVLPMPRATAPQDVIRDEPPRRQERQENRREKKRRHLTFWASPKGFIDLESCLVLAVRHLRNEHGA